MHYSCSLPLRGGEVTGEGVSHRTQMCMECQDSGIQKLWIPSNTWEISDIPIDN